MNAELAGHSSANSGVADYRIWGRRTSGVEEGMHVLVRQIRDWKPSTREQT